MEEGPWFDSHLVQGFFSSEKNWLSTEVKLLIYINCSHLRGVMGYVLGYRSDYGRGTRVRILLGAKDLFSEKKIVTGHN